MPEGPEMRFLRELFVHGGDAYWQLPGSLLPDGRYRVLRGKLAASYNAWRASNEIPGSVRSASFGASVSAHGVESGRRYFVIDVPRLCAALGARPCADFERCARCV